jgi:hypothetical protein
VAQVRAAVDRDHLAVDVAGVVRDQETREIGEFGGITHATQGIAGGSVFGVPPGRRCRRRRLGARIGPLLPGMRCNGSDTVAA